jgi:Mn2+/Fe2+ NRAMP family transporter
MNWKKINNALGPGLLFASTAIGVSHLVQSTRAGANFGFALVGIIVAVNIFKYPFFEYGSRYAHATGESIIDGYKRLGTLPLILYFIVVLLSMFFVTAAVVFVTVGFMDNLLNISALWPSFKLFPTAVLFLVCFGILFYGKFNMLTDLIKVIGFVLFISTITAFVLTLVHGRIEPIAGFVPPDIDSETSVFFIIALMGWMPTALDLSTWNSLWTVEKLKNSDEPATFKETLTEFNIGYWIAALLALCFLTMGAYLIYGSGTELPQGSSAFANAIVELFSSSIGKWSYWIIAASSFSIMFGTSIGVFDGYARALDRTSRLLFLPDIGSKVISDVRTYRLAIVIISVGSFAIIAAFMEHFKALVDLATTISFIIAPFIAIANYRLVTSKYIDEKAIPPGWMRVLSYLGIIFLSGFAIFYIWMKF